MKFGVMMFPTDYSIAPAALGRAAEERGFESIWLPEHSHIPASRKSPWPGGAELPKMYYDVMDPFVALATVASVTSKLKLCTGICLIVQRDVIQLAKEVATLDQLSGGRVILGIGAGWNAEEMEDHGTPFDRRMKVMREKVEALKAIWTEAKAEYHGEFVNFDQMMAWPKPVQQPHPPILVGGGFPGGAKRAIRYGDGWMPIDGRGWDITETLSEYRQMAAAEGREPDDLPPTIFAASEDPDRIRTYRDVGVERLVFGLPPEKEDTILPKLDELAKLMD
ncbi:LLM class F420-dependent oxidoreductase [Minwuia thermotolerans]|uniref:LLM class F420-dependent oxidoreductase n=1 Tax=Minwuia thermotolerans TaxID=2056226 RepID=A0A2M9G2A2_9PROT|nr:LLM class F420-dependent oxidoreductase [Minwuia thermotolerans]PJK29820.1 LLM class F420-dependent oxidoreductase [Minwuia thermotolerans]